MQSFGQVDLLVRSVIMRVSKQITDEALWTVNGVANLNQLNALQAIMAHIDANGAYQCGLGDVNEINDGLEALKIGETQDVPIPVDEDEDE